MNPEEIENKLVTAAVGESVKGIRSFLKLVCEPALLEFGGIIGDRMRSWRLNNLISMLENAQGKLAFDQENGKLQISPRVALSILEASSAVEDEELQEMWAGLFASSCKTGDDGNIIFSDILKRMTSAQAKIVNFVCYKSVKIRHKSGSISSPGITLRVNEIKKITGYSNIHRIDRELGSLSALGLITEVARLPTPPDNYRIDLAATPLALSLCAKCSGEESELDIFWAKQLMNSEEYSKRQNEYMKKIQEAIINRELEISNNAN